MNTQFEKDSSLQIEKDSSLQTMLILAIARHNNIKPEKLIEMATEEDKNIDYLQKLLVRLMALNLEKFRKELNKKNDNSLSSKLKKFFVSIIK